MIIVSDEMFEKVTKRALAIGERDVARTSVCSHCICTPSPSQPRPYRGVSHV
jgi:hypothetical protein